MTITSRRLWMLAVILAFAVGIAVRATPELHIAGRVFPLLGDLKVGYDEGFYRAYTGRLLAHGVWDYPVFVNEYIERQKASAPTFVPPLRFLYIGSSALWCWATGAQPLDGVRQVSALFSILTLGVAFVFTLRAAGRGAALAVLCLMACAPTQIHMAHHGLIDGFFTFWATLSLWTLWEALQRPSRVGPLIAYAASLALMVMTKENAAFVYIAILGILLANRWLRFGTVNRPLLLATLLGPAAGALALIALAGNLESLFTVYILWSTKSSNLDFAIRTQDGPWNRYLVDLMIVSPLVLVLALAAIFQLRLRDPHHRPQCFLLVFLGASFLIMCNLKYGMNLRFANMWDLPLRLLAFTQLSILAERADRLELFGVKQRGIWLAVGVAAICGMELRQYWTMGIQFHGLYELVTEILLRAVNILK